jgi:hypothetical protein
MSNEAEDWLEEQGRRLQAREASIKRFFIPGANDDAEAESVLAAIAAHNGRPVPPIPDRLRRITYKHNGEFFVAEVGQPVDPYYCEDGPVIAILPGDPLLICTRDRGVVRGDPILVGSQSVLSTKFFGEDDPR